MTTLHKKDQPPRPSQLRMGGRGPAESAFSTHGITYQLERVKCGKPRCNKWHGPYWYAYYWSAARARTVSKYIGKKLPSAPRAK